MRCPQVNKETAAAIDTTLFMKAMVLFQASGISSDEDERAVESASLRKALIGTNEGDSASFNEQ